MKIQRSEIDSIPEGLAQNPNFLAYLKALNEGDFADFPDGTYVFFSGGEFAFSGTVEDGFFEKLAKSKTGGFYQEVNTPKEYADLGGFLEDIY